MKAYSAGPGPTVRPGIALRDHERFGPAVVLGERGRGRWQEVVPLDHRTPPRDIQGGRVMAAGLRRFEASGRHHYTLITPRPGDPRVLLRINTYGAYIRGANGRWEFLRGRAVSGPAGWGAYGAAGRVGSAYDGIVIAEPGAVIRVYPSRGDAWILEIPADGEPRAWDAGEWATAQATAQGEGVDL